MVGTERAYASWSTIEKTFTSSTESRSTTAIFISIGRVCHAEDCIVGRVVCPGIRANELCFSGDNLENWSLRIFS